MHETILEEKEKYLYKNLKNLFHDFSEDEIKEITSSLYQSIYSHRFIQSDIFNSIKKKRINSLLNIIFHFLDSKAKWPATITSPESCIKYVTNLISPDRETFIAIYLNTHHNVLTSVVIAYGSVDFAYVNLRTIFSYALKYDATRIIIVHNHPSGDTQPSSEDIAFTQKVQNFSKEFSIILLDHIIIGDSYFSFKGEGLL